MSLDIPSPKKENTMDKKSLCVALMIAVKVGDKNKAKSLIKQGADVEFVDSATKRPVLYQACVNELEPMAKMLLKHRASPNQRSGDGSTSVHAACLTCNVSMISRLVDAGGDLRLHDRDGKTPRDWSMKHSDAKRRRQALEFLDQMQQMAIGGVIQSDEETKKGLPPIIDIPSGLHSRYGNFIQKRTLSSSKKLKSSGQSNSRNVICVQNLGFGKVRIATGDQPVAPLGHIPLILLQDMQHDASVNAYCNGPYMVMEGMMWNKVPVTVKRLHQLPVEGGCIDMLIKESDYMLRLRHQNILLLMGICQTDQLEGLVLVYERITTGSLHHVLYHTQEEITLLLMLTIFRQTCDALVYMHENNIVHGLITSHAIQLVTVSYAKLGNFEYAVDSMATDASDQWMPYPKECYGSLSPELLSGHRPTILSDIYGLTVTLWEVIHGQEPWLGLTPMKIVEERLQLGRSLPIDENYIDNEVLCNLLDAGMSFVPLDRPPTADAFKDWLMDTPKGSSSSCVDGRMQQNVSYQKVAIDSQAVNFVSPGDYSGRVRPKSKTSSLVSSAVSFNRQNSRKKFQMQNVLGCSAKPQESIDQSNIEEQQSAKTVVQRSCEVHKEVEDVQERRTVDTAITQVNQSVSLVVQSSSTGIAGEEPGIRDVRDFMRSTPQSQSPQPDVLERTKERSNGADDHPHNDIVTRLQLSLSPVNDDSDGMTSGEEDKRIPAIEPTISAIQRNVDMSSFHEIVNQVFSSTAADEHSAYDRLESRGTSQASIRYEKLKVMRTAFFSSNSLNDGSGEPPKDENPVSEVLISTDNNQSDSSTSLDSVNTRSSSVGLDSCLQQIISLDELTEDDVRMFKDMANKPLPPLPKSYLKQPMKSDSVKSSTLPLMRVVTIQKLDDRDVYSQNESPALCQVPAQCRGLQDTFTTKYDDIFTKKTPIAVSRKSLAKLTVGQSTTTTPVVSQGTTSSSRVLGSPSWSRSFAVKSCSTGQSSEQSTTVFNQTSSSLKPSPLVSSVMTGSRISTLVRGDASQPLLSPESNQHHLNIAGQHIHVTPVARPSPTLHRRSFKPANHCEPSMVVHLPVNSTAVSKPFMTPPTRRQSPPTFTRYSVVPSAVGEASHMSHVGRGLSSACVTGKELSLQARYPSGTDQSDKTLLQNHVASSNLVTSSSSSESHARSHLALGCNDHAVSRQPTSVELVIASGEKSQVGIQDKVNVNCSHDLSRTTVTTGDSMSDSLMAGITREHSVFLMHVSTEPTSSPSPAIADVDICGSVNEDSSRSYENVKVSAAVETDEPKSDTSAQSVMLYVAVKSAEPNMDMSFENIDVSLAGKASELGSYKISEIIDVGVTEEETKPNRSDQPEMIDVDELMSDEPTHVAEPEMCDMNVELTAEPYYKEPLDAVTPENTDVCNDARPPEPSIAESSDHLNVDAVVSAEQYEHNGVSSEQNEAMSASESVTSTVAVANVEQKLSDLCVHNKDFETGSQISDLALTASKSVLAVFNGDQVGESPLEFSAEDIADMLPSTQSSSIADSPPTSSTSFKSRRVSSETSVNHVVHDPHNENVDNCGISDQLMPTNVHELEQQLNRGDSKCELKETISTVNEECIIEQSFDAGAKLTSVATVESANELASEVSQTSSKSSDLWPLPPSDNESNSCLKGWDILSGAVEYEKLKSEKEPAAKECIGQCDTTYGIKRMTATMKIGISEKVFQHSSLLDDFDNMQRFKSDPILRYPSIKAGELSAPVPTIDAAEEEDSHVLNDKCAAVVVPRIDQRSLPPSEAAATAAVAHNEDVDVRNGKFAAVVVPRVTEHRHTSWEAAATINPPEAASFQMNTSAYESLKHVGNMGQYTTVAPVITHILNNEQPLWTVRSRGDTFCDMDDTRKPFTAEVKHTCLERADNASSDSSDEDDVDIVDMVESAIRLASIELVHKYTHSMIGHRLTGKC